MVPGTIQQKRRARREAGPSYQVPDGDRDALLTVEDRFPEATESRIPLERQWCYALAFLRGDQYVRWSSSRRGLVRTPMPKNTMRVRDMRNFLRDRAERRVAALVNRTPRFKVRPNSQGIEDVQAARVSTKVVTNYWRTLHMVTKRQFLAYWLATTGNAFLKVRWEPRAGTPTVGPDVEPIGVGEDGEMIFAAKGERLYYPGEIETEVVSPFDVIVDPLARGWDDLEWIGQQQNRHISWVERIAPDLAPYVDTSSKSELYEPDTLSLFGQGLDVERSHHTRDEWALVREYWERPSEIYPRGRYIIWAGGVVLRNVPNPTPGGDLPFVHYGDLIVPNSFWFQSILDNLLSPQVNYNRLMSRRLEHINLFSMLKVMFSSQTNVVEPRWTNRIGETITYTGQVPPQYLAPPQLPQDSETHLQMIKSDFDSISGSYGPERGQYVGKASGKAIDLMVEQGNLIKTPVVLRMAQSDERWAHLVLEHFQEYADEERVVKIVGKNERWDVASFKGADLHGNTDVYVDVESVLPKSRTMVLSELMQQAQIGLFNPANPEHMASARKALDQEDMDVVIHDRNLHLRKAELEDSLMLRGEQVPDAQFDEEHDIHMAQHSATRQGDQYADAPAMVKVLFELHMKSHAAFTMPQIGATLNPQQEEEAYAAQEGAGGA